MTTVTVHDLKAMAYCNRGSRPFFERHGLDWGDFVRNGIDAELLIATGDAMALRLVDVAKGRESVEG